VSRQSRLAPAGWAGRNDSHTAAICSATLRAPARVTVLGRPDTRVVMST
jgi:hypothetical protein